MTRKVPQRAIDLVKQFEGYKDTAYLCPANVWTIGYGHTGVEVVRGLTCTKRQAELWLGMDLAKAGRLVEARIGKAVFDDLTDNQYGALCSFVFNLGASPGWKIWQVLKARDFDAVPGQLVRFVNAGGKKLAGLVRRRNAEVELWSLDEPGSMAEDLPSSSTRAMVTPPTPVAADKPVSQSKTFWSGAAIAATSAAGGAQQVQALVAPQAQNSELVQNLLAASAFAIVALGIAIMVFKWLDSRKKVS